MKKLITALVAVTLFTLVLPVSADFNGQTEYATSDYGLYALITGGKFPASQTRTGNKSETGGVMAYINDNPDYTNYPNGYQQWKMDGWFDETAGVAMTFYDGSNNVVFDNCGIDDNTYPTNFYGDPSAPSTVTPGLYCGESMSNNYDWIYAGYFKVDQEIQIKTMNGYFAETYYHTIAPYLNSGIWDFRMNIFSTNDGTGSGFLPAENSFTGDVFTSDNTDGVFSVEDSGVVRHYSAFSNNDDIIYRLSFELDEPITLQPGEYYFSHDATVPEPATMAILGLGGLLLRRKRA